MASPPWEDRIPTQTALDARRKRDRDGNDDGGDKRPRTGDAAGGPRLARDMFRTDAAGNRVPPRRIALRPSPSGTVVQSDWMPFRRAEATDEERAVAAAADRPRPIVLPPPRPPTFVPDPHLLRELDVPQAVREHYATLVRKYMELIPKVDPEAEAALNWKRTIDALARLENEARVEIYTQSQAPYHAEEADLALRRHIRLGLLDGTVRLDEHGRVIMDPNEPGMPLVFDVDGGLLEPDRRVSEAEAEQEDRVRASVLADVIEVVDSEEERHGRAEAAAVVDDERERNFVVPDDACWSRAVGADAPRLHQMAPARFIEAGTPAYSGLLLAHMTGEGKTMAAITAARCLVAKLERRVADRHPGGDGPPVVVVVAATRSTVDEWAAKLAVSGLARQAVLVTHALFSPGKYGPDQWGLRPDMARLLGVAASAAGRGGRDDQAVYDDGGEGGAGADAEEGALVKLRPFIDRGVQFILVLDEAHLFRPLARANERAVGMSPLSHALLTWAQHAQFVVTATATPLQANALDLTPMVACAMTAGFRAAPEYRLPTRRPPLGRKEAIDRASAVALLLDDDTKYKDRQVYEELYGTMSFRNLPFPDFTKPRPGFPDVFWTLPLLPMHEASARDFDEKRAVESRSSTRGFRQQTRRAPRQKLDWALQKVKEHFELGQPGLVYFEFIESAKAFAQMLAADRELTAAVAAINAEEGMRGGWYRMATNAPPPAEGRGRLGLVDTIIGDVKDRAPIVERFNTGRLAVLIITKAGSLGVNLRGCRYVIIGEEYFQRGVIEQVASRAVRTNSHAGLPREDQTVHVYEPIMVRPSARADLTDRSPANFARFYRKFKDLQTSDGDAAAMAIGLKEKLDAVLKRLCKRASLEKAALRVAPCRGPVETDARAAFTMLGLPPSYRPGGDRDRDRA